MAGEVIPKIVDRLLVLLLADDIGSLSSLDYTLYSFYYHSLITHRFFLVPYAKADTDRGKLLLTQFGKNSCIEQRGLADTALPIE